MCVETTQQVLLNRRIELLSSLASRGARAQSVEGVCHSFAACTKGAVDLPWLAIYVNDSLGARSDKDLADELAGVGHARSLARHKSTRRSYRLAATSFDEGLVRGGGGWSGGAPSEEPTIGSGSTVREDRFVPGESARNLPSWLPPLPLNVRFASCFRDRRESYASLASGSTSPSVSVPSTPVSTASTSTSTFSDSFQSDSSSWPFMDLSVETPYLVVSTPSETSPVAQTIMMAITTQSSTTGKRNVLGILVAGLNEHRGLDPEYLKFFESVAQQFETGILNGRAREDDRRTAEALKRLN
jgi:hypothetical protein